MESAGDDGFRAAGAAAVSPNTVQQAANSANTNLNSQNGQIVPQNRPFGPHNNNMQGQMGGPPRPPGPMIPQVNFRTLMRFIMEGAAIVQGASLLQASLGGWVTDFLGIGKKDGLLSRVMTKIKGKPSAEKQGEQWANKFLLQGERGFFAALPWWFWCLTAYLLYNIKREAVMFYRLKYAKIKPGSSGNNDGGPNVSADTVRQGLEIYLQKQRQMHTERQKTKETEISMDEIAEEDHTHQVADDDWMPASSSHARDDKLLNKNVPNLNLKGSPPVQQTPHVVSHSARLRQHMDEGSGDPEDDQGIYDL